MKIFLDANVCLDLLDTTRKNSKNSVKYFLENIENNFYFSGDFITTIYFILTEKRKIDKQKVIKSIDLLCNEIEPIYINHNDFMNAKNNFHKFNDFEDLIILYSAVRKNIDYFVTNDKLLLKLKNFNNIKIINP